MMVDDEEEEDVGLKEDFKLDLRSRQAEYKRRLLQPISSKEELLELLTSLLQVFDILPEELQYRKNPFWKGCTDSDRKKLLSATTWISDVQITLLEKVLVDWKETLEADNLLNVLLLAWFAPVFTSTRCEEYHQEASAGSFQMAALKTISTILSKASLRHQSDSRRGDSIISNSPLKIALQPQAIILLNQTITLLIRNFSLVSIFRSLQSYQVKSKVTLVWSDVIRELIALPDHAANATRGDPPVELLREKYVKFLANQLRDILLYTDCPSDLIAILIAKLFRNGYFQETSLGSEPINLWPTIIRNCIERPLPRWSLMLSKANTSIGEGLLHSLISFVDRYSFRQTPNYNLISSDEMQRPGAEGTIFLSSNTWQMLLQVSSILQVFLPRSSARNSEELYDSEDEIDEEESTISSIFSSPLGSSWTPLTARLLVHLLRKLSNQAVISATLENFIEIWSSASRIKTAPWNQEIYMTIMVLLLISEASPQSRMNLRTSSKFISGVSSHLEHLDSRYRRMGMLVAEIVSEAGEGNNKALSFGRSMWDGKGEGKEESRVLRAVYLGWKGREETLNNSSEASLLKAFGLNAKEDKVEKQAVVSLPIRQRISPQTRKLPQRKPANPRKRLLIEPLDDDGDNLELEKQIEILPPLTQIQGRPRYISESEASSSSDDESDDSEIESMVPATDESEKKEEEFGMNIPQKKRKRPPVYISELSSLFREQDREANKLALKYSEQLIKRKAGWGGEVDENAIDLAIAIISMQNNFRFKSFEDRKRDALTALVCASPQLLGPCLAEQFFSMQYSMSQRVLILNALACGARQMTIQNDTPQYLGLQNLAQDLSQLSMTRSRIEGESRIPEIQRERSLLINKHNILNATSEISTSSNGRNQANSNIYLRLAGPAFIFPLVNRFHAQLEHQSRISSRYRRSGSGILFDPFIVSAFLDTLTILCHCAQNVVNFSGDIVPEVIGLGLAITNTALGKSVQPMHAEHDEEISSSILGAAANLFLVLFDSIVQQDGGKLLISKHAPMIQLVESWAGELFESIDGQGGRGANRAASGAAAILLCIDKLKQSTM